MNHVPGGNWEACWTERGVAFDFPPSGLVAVAAAAVGVPAGAPAGAALAVPPPSPAANALMSSAEMVLPVARVVRTLARLA